MLEEGWEGYPSLIEIKKDRALASEYDLELTVYNGNEYVLFIVYYLTAKFISISQKK